MARFGGVRRGKARHGKALSIVNFQLSIVKGKVRLGLVRLGVAWCGGARRGKAGQGLRLGRAWFGMVR